MFARLPLSRRSAEYSPEERRTLLNLAHRSIETALADEPQSLTDWHPADRTSCRAAGAFTTLHLDGELRGCIGYVSAHRAALPDHCRNGARGRLRRSAFPPVTDDEAPHLKIEISVLSCRGRFVRKRSSSASMDLLVIGGARRGLLLPQVPLEWGWDREPFWQQTCLKAGLRPMRGNAAPSCRPSPPRCSGRNERAERSSPLDVGISPECSRTNS